jgi:hypothetical protein
LESLESLDKPAVGEQPVHLEQLEALDRLEALGNLERLAQPVAWEPLALLDQPDLQAQLE